MVLFFWHARFVANYRRPSFFKRLDGACRLCVVARVRRQLAVTHRPQLAAQRLLRYGDLEVLPEPLAEIDDPPADHAMRRRGSGRSRSSLQARHGAHHSTATAARSGLRSIRPSGPCALNRNTQSRTICSVTPPISAAASGYLRHRSPPAPEADGQHRVGNPSTSHREEVLVLVLGNQPPFEKRPGAMAYAPLTCHYRNASGLLGKTASISQTALCAASSFCLILVASADAASRKSRFGQQASNCDQNLPRFDIVLKTDAGTASDHTRCVIWLIAEQRNAEQRNATSHRLCHRSKTTLRHHDRSFRQNSRMGDETSTLTFGGSAKSAASSTGPSVTSIRVSLSAATAASIRCIRVA